MRTDHLMSSAHITINEKVFTSLTAEQQKLLTDAAREATQWARKTAEKDTDETVKKMATEGATVITPDRKAINAKAKDAVAVMEKDGSWSQGLWQKIQGM